MQRSIPIFLLFLLIFCTTLNAQDNTIKDDVIAQPGEGIFSLLRRNGMDPSVYLHPFIELNKEALKSDSSLVMGQTYKLPQLDIKPEAKPATDANPPPPKPEEMKIHDPIFGKKYESITVIDKQLEGAVYYLVAGHSGPDPGAMGTYGSDVVSEDEYAYDVTLRLARNLMEHGAIVYMIVRDENDGIRDDIILPLDKDEVHYPDKAIPYSQRQRLRDRTRIVNELYAKHKGAYQRMLAIHIDSRSQGENIDVFFYHHENSNSGKALAENIHQSFTSKYKRHQPSRNYQGVVTVRSSLYVVKYSHPPAIFIELGNIQNHRDQLRFILPDNRQALANWITDGILTDKKK